MVESFMVESFFFLNHILVLRNTCIFIVKSQFLETYGTLSYWMGFRFSGSNKDTTQRWIIYEMSLFLFENYLSCLNVGIPDLIGDLCLSRDQGPFVFFLYSITSQFYVIIPFVFCCLGLCGYFFVWILVQQGIKFFKYFCLHPLRSSCDLSMCLIMLVDF